jgi:hypothetical protein
MLGDAFENIELRRDPLQWSLESWIQLILNDSVQLEDIVLDPLLQVNATCL